MRRIFCLLVVLLVGCIEIAIYNAYLQLQKLKKSQLVTDHIRDVFLVVSFTILCLAFRFVFEIMKPSCMKKLMIRNRPSPIAKTHDDIEMAESDLVPNKRKTIENGKLNTK